MDQGIKNIALVIFAMIYSLDGFSQANKAEEIKPLQAGDTIPSVSITARSGKKVNTKAMVASKPAVILFYRGGWCPYCNAHLSDIQEVESYILKQGYKIIAISPDSRIQIGQTKVARKLNYEIYSDPACTLINAIGIGFQARHYAPNVSYDSNPSKGVLPVPSVFIVGTDGVIKFKYACPDYKVRMNSTQVLQVLKALNKGKTPRVGDCD